MDRGDVLLGTSAQEEAWEVMWVRMRQSECAFAHRSNMDLADLAGSPEPDLSWLVELIQVGTSREYLDSVYSLLAGFGDGRHPRPRH